MVSNSRIHEGRFCFIGKILPFKNLPFSPITPDIRQGFVRSTRHPGNTSMKDVTFNFGLAIVITVTLEGSEITQSTVLCNICTFARFLHAYTVP